MPSGCHSSQWAVCHVGNHFNKKFQLVHRFVVSLTTFHNRKGQILYATRSEVEYIDRHFTCFGVMNIEYLGVLKGAPGNRLLSSYGRYIQGVESLC